MTFKLQKNPKINVLSVEIMKVTLLLFRVGAYKIVSEMLDLLDF